MRRSTLLKLFAGVSVSALPGFRLPWRAPRRVVVVGSGVWIAIGGDVFVWVESESELGILVELPVNDEV